MIVLAVGVVVVSDVPMVFEDEVIASVVAVDGVGRPVGPFVGGVVYGPVDVGLFVGPFVGGIVVVVSFVVSVENGPSDVCASVECSVDRGPSVVGWVGSVVWPGGDVCSDM